MNQKKICILGSVNVGKTSLVRRYVDDTFDGSRQSTIGVTVSSKAVTTQTGDLDLVIWDVYGENRYQRVQNSYLKNTSGYLLIIDGTDARTLKTAAELRERVRESQGQLPYVLVINKVDRSDEWKLSPDDWEALAADARAVIQTSAKTGNGVARAFQTIANALGGETKEIPPVSNNSELQA